MDKFTEQKIIESFFLYIEKENIHKRYKDYKNNLIKNDFLNEETHIKLFAELCIMFLSIEYINKSYNVKDIMTSTDDAQKFYNETMRMFDQYKKNLLQVSIMTFIFRSRFYIEENDYDLNKINEKIFERFLKEFNEPQ